MRNYSVLLGNDINNFVAGKSWSDLLKELTTYLSVTVNFPDDKPFPLAYEEIYFKALEIGVHSEREIKKFVAQHVFDMKPGPIHISIMNLSCENILTTNYDLSLEAVFETNPNKLENDGYVKESLYSVFRFHTSGNKKIWHIHGSANAYQSITLGYEHYSGYLQRMRNYVVTGTKDSYKKQTFQPLTKAIKNNEVENKSWLDIFFTHDVHIFGLSLDFNETDLWWLLTYRAKVKYGKNFPIKNVIYYYIPTNHIKKSQSKIDMLKSVGVEIINQNGYTTDKRSYYENIIQSINNRYA